MGCFQSTPQDVIQTTPAKSTDKKHDISPIYDALPSKAQEYEVRNVYDGDTLTLIDQRRVRFLGIDTPELKEKQAFAEEAKAYTRNLCHKKNIWLTFEHEEKDHYGRLLAFVWVKAPQGKGYLCVNEGIIAEGLATAYTPGGKKLHNWDKLIDMQKRARETKRGMWVNFNDYSVLKTSNGSAFHQRNCKHISKSRNLVQLKASEAMDKGLHPCRTCLADK